MTVDVHVRKLSKKRLEEENDELVNENDALIKERDEARTWAKRMKDDRDIAIDCAFEYADQRAALLSKLDIAIEALKDIRLDDGSMFDIIAEQTLKKLED